MSSVLILKIDFRVVESEIQVELALKNVETFAVHKVILLHYPQTVTQAQMMNKLELVQQPY